LKSELSVISLPKEIQQLKGASGGSAWDSVTLITADGEKTSFGLVGKYQSVENIGTGHFWRRADYGIFANAEGMDETGRWRQDNSGQVHSLDSEEARAVAISDAYLARRGYLFPEQIPADFRTLHGISSGGRRFDRVEVTPAGGRTITLWIETATHLLERAVVKLSEGDKTIRYSDYRSVQEMMLPFSITSDYRDDLDDGTANISKYQVSAVVAESKVQRPDAEVRDARITNGADETTAKAYLDKNRRFFIVDASIDGKGPYPFILDTGGHDMLTPEFCRRNGLEAAGNGFSTGAGAGKTKTKFTKVKTISVGGATISDQPFLVLDIDLGKATGDGKPQPIAGILGLELFERFAITIDYRGRKMTLHARSNLSCRGQAIPIRFTSDMPLASATLDGRSGMFGIDTGNNSDLIVFRRWAESNHLAAVYEPGQTVDAISVGGAVEFTKANAKSFQLGGEDLGAIRILLAPRNAGSLSANSEAGNIGNSILSGFTVTFDYRAGIMCLQR
jgi:hypothetical protein